MSLLPLMLKLGGKRAAVVGAGAVAARHIPKLIEEGIKEIVVYAPTLHPSLEVYVSEERFRWEKGNVQPTTSFDTDLLFLTTNDSLLHKTLYQYKKPYQLVYVADNPALSDFYFPMTVKKGSLTIALSTGGSSPTYAKKVMKQIEYNLSETIEEDLLFLNKARKRVLESELNGSVRKKILQQCASPSVLQNPKREQVLEQIINKSTNQPT
ncbi:precorrin-2 dehydrogenase/sirohydrochlorin ferrochelatase family protein [Halalkalibacter lacteus]|uniref:precorrin-2 dehydrogenase/sirohydrochlorin ferrochelatase family protein n=1 Tax=Halalkalibacter lacteus TaxID=3090663 RepID=UPI002FC78214